MVRVPIKVFPTLKSVLESIAFTRIVEAFNRDTFDWDTFKMDTFAISEFNTDTFALDAFMKVAFALLMLSTDTFVGPKVRNPAVKLVPIVIPSDATIVLTVIVEELRMDTFVVPNILVDEFVEPTNTVPVVKLGPTLIVPVVTFVPTDNSVPAFIVLTVRIEAFSTDAFVVPRMVVVELVDPTKTVPVNWEPIVMVPFDKFVPIDNSELPANKVLMVAEDTFILDAFIVSAFKMATFSMSEFIKEAFIKDAFKKVV